MRYPDWRSRLHRYLGGSARLPFVPGTHDCALFAGGAVDAMTGTDPFADYRGRYTTIRGGLRVLRKAGFTDHIALIAADFEEVPPLLAQVGDLAAVPGDDLEHALGIVTGATIAVLRPDGLGYVPLTAAERAFRV